MQAGGAEAIAWRRFRYKAGIEVCAPVHDAFLIAAPVEKINEDTARMRLIMSAAGQAVAGLPIATDVKQVLYPDRYMDERGVKMWETVQRLLAALKQRGSGMNANTAPDVLYSPSRRGRGGGAG